MEGCIEKAEFDALNVVYVTTPDTFKEVVSLLISELRRRHCSELPGLLMPSLTCCERVFRRGLKEPRANHVRSREKDQPYIDDANV